MKMCKKLSLALALCFAGLFSWSQKMDWPVLKVYEKEYLKEVKMPVGGIGTGTVSLTGSGALRDWEIMNRPAKGFNTSSAGRLKRQPFFSVYVENPEGEKNIKLLEGPVLPGDIEGQEGSTFGNHGLPRFTSAIFATAYPFGQVRLKDENFPVEATVGAYNPLIPGNAKDSGIPMAVLMFRIKNVSDEVLQISVNGNLQNFIGYDGYAGKSIQNRNIYTEANGVKGIRFVSEGVDRSTSQWGSMALVSLNDGQTTYRTSWKPTGWGKSILDFWDDFSADGLLEERELDGDAPIASLAVKKSLAPGETKTFTFLLTWHFPNRKAWGTRNEELDAIVGNYYANHYDDAWDVVRKEVPRLQSLETKTLDFVNAFLDSDLPASMKEAALFNLCNLRSQLVFRIKSGHLMGWEGTFSNRGSSFGSCTHVWNYEHTIPFLFGELAKTMREVEFKYATDTRGLMSFRVGLPLEENGQVLGLAAADGQMGTIIKAYRDWQLSGDDEMLKELYPHIKRAMEFAWIKGGWDGDKDGVMEGAQHNTMDVEYYGPNPQMGFMYLGALKAIAEMGDYVGDKKFAKECRKLYQTGSQWIEDNLFNGEYYEQDIRPPMSIDNVAPGLIRGYVGMDSARLASPDYQLGEGILVDQFIGQVLAQTSGLGYLADREHSKLTHRSIMKYNYRDNLQDHTNFMRSYALGDEAGLLMADYPGVRPKIPFPYFTEIMTGFEYTAIIGMLYDGMTEDAILCIQNIRDRYDGLKRNPFNEAEYGNHYSRAMAAWGTALAYTGFQSSAVDQSMSFNPVNGNYFWSNGYQYGSIEIQDSGNDKSVTITSHNGDLTLKSFTLNGFGKVEFKKGKTFEKNSAVRLTIVQ